MKRGELKELAKKVIEENPKITQNRALAKILHNKYPLLFKSIEEARSAIRTIMGQHGKLQRKSLDTSFLTKLARLRVQHEVEEGEPEDITPYKISPKFKKILVISDTHIPYHDMKALDIALEYGYDRKVDAVVFNGDLMDFNTISRFLSRPNEMRMVENIQQGKKILKYIRDALGCKVIFHEGNHDIRCEHYLIRQAPEFWGISSTQLKNLLECPEMNIDYVKNVCTMHYGKLTIAHGNHIIKGVFSPVNPARGAFTRANASVMIGHCHRSSEHVESDIKGKITGCWSVGALTTTTPSYNPQVSKHNQGFAIVELTSSQGDFIVDNRKIIEYKVR